MKWYAISEGSFGCVTKHEQENWRACCVLGRSTGVSAHKTKKKRTHKRWTHDKHTNKRKSKIFFSFVFIPGAFVCWFLSIDTIFFSGLLRLLLFEQLAAGTTYWFLMQEVRPYGRDGMFVLDKLGNPSSRKCRFLDFALENCKTRTSVAIDSRWDDKYCNQLTSVISLLLPNSVTNNENL